MIGGLQNIPKIPELKKKILFTLMMLAVYRVGCHIPTPGIDGSALAAFFGARQGTLFGLFDMFSGGALSQMSVMALGYHALYQRIHYSGTDDGSGPLS